jgi:hypothetical protein
MIKQRLMGSGFAPLQTNSVGETVTTSLTGAGTSSQANALAIVDDINIFTTVASNSGARLPDATYASLGDKITVVNYGANALLVYPPTGGRINNGSVNASVSIAANKIAVFINLTGIDYAFNISA